MGVYKGGAKYYHNISENISTTSKFYDYFQLQTLSQPLHCINLCKYKVMLMLLLVMQVEIYSR